MYNTYTYNNYTYNKFNGIYGYRRITIYLNHYLGAKVNHKCVHRLMKLLSASSRIEQLTPINFEHFRSQTCSGDVSYGS